MKGQYDITTTKARSIRNVRFGFLFFVALFRNVSGKRVVKLAGVIGIMLAFSGGIFGGSSNVYADDSITLNIDTNNLVLNLVPKTSVGDFAESSNANISVSTTCDTGYTLSIASSSNSTDLTSGSNIISSISSPVTNADFSASANTTYNNKWGYKPSQYVEINGDNHTTISNTGANASFRPLPGAGGEILAITDTANSSADGYTISIGARATTETPIGSYISEPFVITAVPNFTGLTINYDGNGLYFDGDSTKTVNSVFYDATFEDVSSTEKYSHTPNVSDEGVQNGNYANSYTMNDVVTIDGASTLHIKLTYAGESASYDWVSFWAGNYPSYTAASNYSTGIQNCGGGTVTNGKYGGGSGTTVECDISGDTVTFAFKSDGSGVGNGYGYYAVITGSGNVYTKSIVDGEYKTPGHNDGGYNFLGWSEDQNATTPAYETEADISSNLEKVNGDPAVTLYAIYQKLFAITYHPNFTGATASDQTQTITAGASSNLKQAGTSTFTRTGYRIKEWNTKADGSGTSYAGNSSYGVPANIAFGDSMDLYAIWVPIYQVIYDSNGASAGVMTNVKHINTGEGDKFDLFASNFSRSGYGFAGWSLDSNAQPGGSSRIYGPNEIFTAPAYPGSNTLTLYAVWVPSAGNLQNWTGCSSMSVGDITALKDQRDSNVYTVAKLADENCWMVENLRLNNTATSNSTGTLAQGYASGFKGLANPESDNFNDSTTANSLYSTTNITGSNQGYRFPRFNNTNTNARATNPSAIDNRATATNSHGIDLDSAIYSYGNYYTWAAAVADIRDYTTTATETVITSSSLCPKGWKLPYGGSGTNANGGMTKGGFAYLDIKLGNTESTQSTEEASNKWRKYPNNFLYSGDIEYSESYPGSSGIYWSSTAYFGYSSNVLRLIWREVNPGPALREKSEGATIRCLIAG